MSASTRVHYAIELAAAGATLAAARAGGTDWLWSLLLVVGAVLLWHPIGRLADRMQAAACLAAGLVWAATVGLCTGALQWPLLAAAGVAGAVRCLPGLAQTNVDEAFAKAAAIQAVQLAEHALGPRPTGPASASFQRAVETAHDQINHAAAQQLALSALGHRPFARLLQALLRRAAGVGPHAMK